MAGKKRERGRELATYLSCGFPPRDGWKLDYETYVSLLQNERRVLMRSSVAVLNALLANSDSPLESEWGDAISWDAAAADEAVKEANRSRSLNRARSKRR